MKNTKMNHKNHNPRFLLASTTAALATLIVPIAGGLYGYLEGPSVLADGTIDNAPYRASGALLFLSPILFLVLLVAWLLITIMLDYWNVLTWTYLLLCCVGSSIIFGSMFAYAGYDDFGLRDAIISFTTFSFCTFLSLVLGWLAWCFIGFAWYKKVNLAKGKKPCG
ncbi:MAG: hypothetical protein GY797_38570 [Deltaproteobacteria bacterium]|nr:hypothetical protein [Deltaproteobacteria bacterium]